MQELLQAHDSQADQKHIANFVLIQTKKSSCNVENRGVISFLSWVGEHRNFPQII